MTTYLERVTSHKLDAASFRTFIFQGKALFTLENKEKGTYITFKVQKLKQRRGQEEDTRHFDVYAKALNDQYAGLVYIGRVDRKLGELRVSGRVDKNHVGILTFNWIIRNWNNLEEFEIEGKLGMYHQGVCCKCGLPLTVPESIENGIGPQCKKYRESRSIKILQELNLYVTGMKYEDMVIAAIEKNPSILEKVFISDAMRRKSEWIQSLETWKDFGLF